LGYAVQALVALRPQVGSARTVGSIYTQLLLGQFDPNRPTEQILNAPTNEAWIDPWTSYLDSLGVDLHAQRPARKLNFDGQRVTAAVLADGQAVTADEFVLAVPVEVAPSFVTPGMARAAPELARIDRLDTAWMNGIQFYLTEDVSLSRGHQVYADAPWALTSISQRQFWTDYDVDGRGPEEVEGVLSVIASDWDTPGILHEKPARECTREEIATEIWAQLKTHLNTEERQLSDEMLVDYFLDPAIVETDEGVENRSPLLINTVGSLKNRPPADVGIENLTLASDYVRTNSDLASMESANEAGRRAANAIFDRRGISERARIWELQEPSLFEPFKRQDRIRYRLGLPHPAEVTQSLRSVTSRLSGSA
ncbi:MAG: FAD-dependent oxidoreductase, partial [Halovenus sp.]